MLSRQTGRAQPPRFERVGGDLVAVIGYGCVCSSVERSPATGKRKQLSPRQTLGSTENHPIRVSVNRRAFERRRKREVQRDSIDANSRPRPCHSCRISNCSMCPRSSFSKTSASLACSKRDAQVITSILVLRGVDSYNYTLQPFCSSSLAWVWTWRNRWTHHCCCGAGLSFMFLATLRLGTLVMPTE